MNCNAPKPRPGDASDRHPTDRGLTPVLDRVQARLLLTSCALGHVLGESYSLLYRIPHKPLYIECLLIAENKICCMILPELFLLASNRLS